MQTPRKQPRLRTRTIKRWPAGSAASVSRSHERDIPETGHRAGGFGSLTNSARFAEFAISTCRDRCGGRPANTGGAVVISVVFMVCIFGFANGPSRSHWPQNRFAWPKTATANLGVYESATRTLIPLGTSLEAALRAGQNLTRAKSSKNSRDALLSQPSSFKKIRITRRHPSGVTR